MKAKYIEHSSGPHTAIGVLVNDSPVPQERLEDIAFRDTAFKTTARPKPELVAAAKA